MASELELKMLARLRAHEVLIENLLRLAFNNDADAVREFAARQRAMLDHARPPDLDAAMTARLPYETQEALGEILDGAIRHAESKQHVDVPNA